jgi:2-keto-4-pentenoate hydratase
MIGAKKPSGEQNGMAANPGVEKARTEVTALMLMEAHDIGEQFLPFAKERGINDVAAAYRVQDAYARRLMAGGNTQTGGFKIGLTTKKMQEMCGIDSPVSGYVAANRIYTSPTTVDAMEHTHLGLEFEIAVKIGHDLPFRPVPYAQEEVIRDILVAPGIELVDDRNADYATLEALSLIADNSWNAGIVVGAWAEPPADLGAM